jgi:hypothetical protein
MSVSTFLSNENAQMLWEVILDTNSVVVDSRTQEIFSQVLPDFYEKEKKNHKNLLQINKQFISTIMNILAQQQQQQMKPKITFEELQEERMSKFERELNSKEQDFRNSMALPIPPTPDFADNEKDEPLTEMEKIIKRTIEERNLEMQKIQMQRSLNKAEAEKWIQGQTTSVKEEFEIKKQNALNSFSGAKTIQIGKEIKQISWGEDAYIEPIEENNVIIEEEKNPTSSSLSSKLFSKLKTKDPMKQLEDLINERFDKLEAFLQGLSSKSDQTSNS